MWYGTPYSVQSVMQLVPGHVCNAVTVHRVTYPLSSTQSPCHCVTVCNNTSPATKTGFFLLACPLDMQDCTEYFVLAEEYTKNNNSVN